MPTSAEAVAVVLIAVLPGGIFLWTLERIVGRWGIGLSDRLLRFVGISAVLHALAAGATYRIWHDYLRADALPADAVLPLWLWPVAALYVLVPAALGSLLGLAVWAGRAPTWLAGSSSAPTAWDQLFFQERAGYVRMKLKSGSFVGGAYDSDSYAGGFPEPADLWLSQAAEVDPETGEFARAEVNQAILKGYGLLVRWDELEYLEFAPREGTS